MEKKLCFTLVILLVLSAAAVAQFGSHFNTGMEAFKNNKYIDAMQEFGSACQENPKSVECRFYYALALYYNDKLKESRSEFAKIVKEQKSSEWGVAAKSYIEAIDLGYYAPLPEKTFSGSINLSFENDDNITYTPFLVAGRLDNKSSALVSLSYKPFLFSSRPISISCSGYGLIYDRNTKYNVNGGSSDMSLRVPLPLDSFASVYYGTGNYYLQSDPYYSTDYLEGWYSLNFPANSQIWTSLYIGGANNLYKIESYKGYDSYDSKLGIRHDLSAATYIQYELKSSDTRSRDFMNRSEEYIVGETIYFPYFHRLLIVARYVNKNFKYDDSLAGELRHDTSFGLDLYVTKDISRSLSIGIRYVYTNYTSNLDSSNTALGYGSYIDHILSLSISYKF